ncbi:MAG: LacI family transcriptional regulator [Calditrichaeota bacterium]|nr:MAG: LacI family transcriptional regulator [Calditrichota bacterium]
MSPTIKDVAKKAGVSLSTVSLVINQKENISPETRRKVEQAIAELNYHPRRNARGLAAKRTYNIGFVLTEDHFSRAEPFYTKVFLGTEFEARQFHYYILLTTVPKNFREGSHVPRFLLEKNVDGVIMSGKVPQALIEYTKKCNVPVVYVDFYPPRGKYSCVTMDNESGGYMAVEHLIQLGHRRIAFLGGDRTHPSLKERLEGYKKALTENKIAVDEKLIVIDEPETGFTNGYEAAKKLLKTTRNFTAVFAFNDAMAIGCIKYLKENNLKIPKDISVVGFDDIEQDIMIDPQLTTIRVFKEELGAVAVRRMVEMIESKNFLSGRVQVPVELVVRKSTAPVAKK